MRIPLMCGWAALLLMQPLTAEVVINEIMYHPASENIAEEYIELSNTGPATADVSGWAFTSGITFTLPAGSTIAAGGRLVVAADAAAFAAKYPGVTPVVAGWTGRLSNSANKITLVDASGAKMNEVAYSDDGDWGIRRKDWWSDFGHKGVAWDSGADGANSSPPFSNAAADVLGKSRSLELVNEAFDNSTGQNWLASLTVNGTPGTVNSVAAADIAPVIRDVTHFPAIPRSSDPVYVTARVTDDHGLTPTVSVNWRVDGGSAFTSVAMVDDGLHGDTLAADGIFGVALPVQPNGTIIEFYIAASDGTHSRSWPAPVCGDDAALTRQQTANCLYQVDDTPYAGAQPIYRIVMKAADKTELAFINSGGTGGAHPYAFYSGESNDQTFSHARFNASFVSVDGTGTELRYRAGIRNRGNGSRSKQPQGLNVVFPNEDPWQGATQYNLNTQYTPYQLFGAVLFAKAGVPAPQSRAVQLRWNAANPVAAGGSPSYGFYACNEAWDSDLADHRFPTDGSGNLYRGVRMFEGATAGGTSLPNGGDFSKIVPGAAETQSLVQLYKINYNKKTNTAEDVWTDLIGLTAALAKGHSSALYTDPVTYDADYVTAVRAVVDVDEWMRWFAVNTLVDNCETNLSNGDGDDFHFYFGINDPRCKLMPYDLDTIIGGGDTAGSTSASLFRMINRGTGSTAPTPMNAFMKHPQFAPIYYAALKTLLDDTFKPANFNSMAQQSLASVVSQTVIDGMKTYNTARTTYIASQLPLTISVTTFPTAVSGYPKTTTTTTTLGGTANAITTRAVKVNGVAASWTAWSATWSATSVALKPGINRVLIQAFGAASIETERSVFDVWYDDSSVATASGTLAANTTWTAAGGPYSVTASLIIPTGVTLTIEPGTTVYLGSAVNLTVNNGGRIVANGTDTAPIRFSRIPGTATSWGGIDISGSTTGPSPLTEIRHAHIEFNGSTAIHAQSGGEVELEGITFGNTAVQYISLDAASFLIYDCVFPTCTAAFESMHGTAGIKTGGRGIVRHCFYGVTNGYNDVFDFTGGQRPAPILQMIDNVFMGSGDDILDIDGTDAWIEGNIFLHCHKNGAPDSSAAVSGGDYGADTSEITIVGNIFYDVDSTVTAKQGNYYTFDNNTVVHQTKTGGTDIEGGVLNLQDAIPLPVTTYAAGVLAESNIIYDCEQLLRNYSAADTVVTLNNNLMGFAWSGPGAGNVAAEPLFQHVPALAETTFTSWSAAQAMKQWFALKSGSPARGTGPNGRDKGGAVARGVCLSANVPAATDLTAANISVGPVPSAIPTWPSGYTHYRWRIDGGSWSAATPIASQISLSGLAAGAHTVEVAGKNDALFWQDDTAFGPEAGVASLTWTIDPGAVPPDAAPQVRINEVLAKNSETAGFGGVYPDLIELYNTGNATANLAGWGLTDNASVPYKYVFPAGTSLAAGAYLVIYASSAATVPAPKTGFAFKDQGDSLTLTRPAADGGGVADAVAFGNQLSDYSIGRRAADGGWDLCRPTFGTVNVIAAQGNAAELHINEWLASAGALSTTDFIELFNPASLPVNIGGGYLTDNPAGWPDQHLIRQLTFVGASGYALFKADADPGQGADHVSFRLAASQGEIGLSDGGLALIDSVIYGPQSTDVSQGRSPNGGSEMVFFTQPTPGGPNPGSTVATSTTTVNLLPINASWKYKSSATDYSGTFQAAAFNDTAWASGAQLLHYETGTLTSASGFVKATQVPINGTIPFNTTYFRTHFTWNGSTSGVVLRATTMIDDGAVIYLNGQEALRIRVAAGAVTFGTFAGGAIGANTDAAEETFILPTSMLVQGDNVIAAEVHQVNATSSDVVWGLKLDADVTATVAAAQVVINEVLARNETLPNPDTSLTGWVELFNPATTAADISDMSLSTTAASPRAWIAPAGTVIPAGGYLVVQCNPALPASLSNTGFALDPAGSGLYLFHALAIGGGLRDALTWGNQLADRSIGRVPNGSGAFALNLPTRATLNTAAATGSLANVRINEWLASPAAGADWFELFNSGSSPVLLGGNYLTDTLTNKTKHLITPLTYIGGSGASRWLQFIADNSSQAGHANFALSGSGEALGLYTAAGVQLDALAFGAQTTGVSEGRFPDGSATILAMLPTPAALNTLPNPDSDGDGMPDAWEIANGLDPNSPADAALDADHDGMSNLQEYLAGTDPQDAASRFTNAISHDGGVPTIRFTARAGRGYTVQYSNTLGEWTKLSDVAPQTVTTDVAVADPAAVGQTSRFYRIITPPQP
ncbi:MAG: lamin tail domain-containing protein [Verrucomicrobiota bacterium]